MTRDLDLIIDESIGGCSFLSAKMTAANWVQSAYMAISYVEVHVSSF